MEKNTNNYQVPSIHKAIDVLEYLMEESNKTMKDIARDLKLPASTCFNILSSLENRGMIIRDSKTLMYRSGYNLMRLGLSIYQDIDLRNIASPKMDHLANTFEETVYLSIIDFSTYDAIVIDRKMSNKSEIVVLRSIGDKAPLYASGTGKSLLVALNDKQLNDFFKKTEFIAYTDQTLVSESQIRKEIEIIKKKGYALSLSEYHDGVFSISAPIRNYSGEVVAAISVAGWVDSMKKKGKEKKIINEIKASVLELTAELGYKSI